MCRILKATTLIVASHFALTAAQAHAMIPFAPFSTCRVVVAQNPARGSVDISFVTRAGTLWRLDVLDAAGRRVRDLGGGLGDGAQQSRRWDARDALGVPARAGIYWVRLASGAHQSVRRFALLEAR